MADNNYYLAPAPFLKGQTIQTHADKTLSWSKEVIQQGLAYLRLQPAYPYIQEGMDLINGTTDPSQLATLSSAKTESVVRNLKELIAAQSNIRVVPSFKTAVEEYADQASILNKAYMSWQRMVFADRAIRQAWQYAAGGGTGYLGIRWNPDYWAMGTGDIELVPYGPLDVIPCGLPANHNLQQAYVVAVKIATPWHLVVRKYPEYADKLRPSQVSNSFGAGNVIAQSVKAASAALRKYMPGATQMDADAKPWPTVDLYYLYIDDDAVNNTASPILMGDPGTSWEYTVPYIGQQLTVGYDKEGRPTFRTATAADCKMYPNRRKIVATDDVILTPDPCRQVNEYWHARVPVVQWRADDWAWAFLGFPLSKAGSSLEKANISMLRGLVDATNVRLSPPRGYDRNTMSQALAQTLNTRVPNQVVGLDYTFAGEQLKPLLPADYYNTNPAAVDGFIEANEARIKNQMGVADAAALARARQLPSGDSLEKIMEALGPVIKDQSRNMEASIRDLGEMWKSCVFQFYIASRRMQMLGNAGLTEEDWDLDPGTLTPKKGTDLPGASRYAIARQHALNFTFSVTPYSLHELNSVSRKLLFLQLSRFGFPISWWKLAEVFDIDDFGPKPYIEDPETGQRRQTKNELETWIAQQEMMAKMAAAKGDGGGGAKGKGHQGAGRPPTGQQLPTMEQKSDGRPIVRESKR